MINVMERFLNDEISSQELYEDIFNFINSFHIRNGEFEANYYIIKKMDADNFIIYAENVYPDGHREIPYSLSVYKQVLCDSINGHAERIGLKIMEQ
ncbi:hypothetical protein JYG23_04600 [Sedimentibacter sp. zth1]|uniref:hypothetical protein n=1 Tax=Sedimentibacter sp. zth1 TaxID=2816908 RepID=UPI001A910ADB|nr:hypothetical protein [Sedimentibacter sp. zth1]QSX06730.1 hypothetical protein JYG23_04600 [Sedimentibacter sp. zth1]